MLNTFCLSGVCAEHDPVWLSGCWFELHKSTGRMVGKVIWLLDYRYCTGSAIYLIICSLSLKLGSMHGTTSASTGVQGKLEKVFLAENCSVACSCRHSILCKCSHSMYIYTNFSQAFVYFSLLFPSSHPLLTHTSHTHSPLFQLPDLNLYTPKPSGHRGKVFETCIHPVCGNTDQHTQWNTHRSTFCHIILRVCHVGCFCTVKRCKRIQVNVEGEGKEKRKRGQGDEVGDLSSIFYLRTFSQEKEELKHSCTCWCTKQEEAAIVPV